MPVPAWSIDAPTYTTSARTGYEEILPDKELDRCIFHAAQVCNLITRFTTGPYHNAGLSDIVSFLRLGPRLRSTHLSAEGSIFGFGWNVALPSATWSLLFQMAIGADACMRLHDLGFDHVLRPRAMMDFEADCARLDATMETRDEDEATTTNNEHDAAAAKGAESASVESETEDETKANSIRDNEEVAVLHSNNASVEMDTSAEEEANADKGNNAAEAEDTKEADKESSTAKCLRNASAAIDIVTEALGSPWVRIHHDVAEQLYITYQQALKVCASKSNIE